MRRYVSFLFCVSYWQSRVYLLLVLVCLTLAGLGEMPQSSAGWVLPIPQPIYAPLKKKLTKGDRRRRERLRRRKQQRNAIYQAVANHNAALTWQVPLLRTLFLGLGFLIIEPKWFFLSAVPYLVWLLQLFSIRYPLVGQQPEYKAAKSFGRLIETTLILAISSFFLWQSALYLFGLTSSNAVLGAAGVVSVSGGSSKVSLETMTDSRGNKYLKARLSGSFELSVEASDSFRRRLLIIFLRLLEDPDYKRGSRPTRDGRTPFVTGPAISEAYSVQKSKISRWERYWLDGDWRRLLSERAPDVLTLELQDQIVATFAKFPWWGLSQVHHYLNQQEIKVSHRQVRQAAEESGFLKLRQELRKKYVISPENFRPRDECLVQQLLKTNQQLIEQLEKGDSLPQQLEIEIGELNQLANELAIQPVPLLRALPFMLRVQQLLFGSWEMITDEAVCCIYCGSCNVCRKSRKPRIKTYTDDSGQIQQVEVYRYYCRNPECDKGSFTNLPPNLLPHSPYTFTRHMLAVQLYGWVGGNYRRSAQALGVSSVTVYRWVSAFGDQLLPVAALFGVIRCSGAIGVDEKFVLVPKNNKPKSKMSRWMYLYVAVDCYTYDLLHIQLYRYRNEASARAFLLELRAKGYKPKVVVTDLWEKYNSLISEIFPHATHQECIFHALKALQKKIKDVYGSDYKENSPEAVDLKQKIYRIFDARTKRTALKRYQEVINLRKEYVEQNRESEAIFTFLETHWPRLIPAIESQIIPRTNNTAELVIRRFDQHYQNFCGFDNFESAKQYVAVFEKLYRFTPFSQDAQPHLRGRCPLEVAGYDVSQMPMATICAGLSPQWSSKTSDESDEGSPEVGLEALSVFQGVVETAEDLVPSL